MPPSPLTSATESRAEAAPPPARRRALPMLALAVVCWAALVWLVVDMGHPLAQLTMPMSPEWTTANVVAVWTMWAVMMAAMMLPSTLPMVLAFARMAVDRHAAARAHAFVAAYLLVWFAFSVAASVAQWALQAVGWVDPMIVSRSRGLNAALLLAAGIYQFTPLKRVCLANCRSPMVFLIGEWRPGAAGAFAMGVRHGLFCMGCCWALMLILFVGGAMNLAWVAALSIVVAIEKIAPQGQRLAQALGLVLMTAGAWSLWVPGA